MLHGVSKRQLQNVRLIFVWVSEAVGLVQGAMFSSTRVIISKTLNPEGTHFENLLPLRYRVWASLVPGAVPRT